MKDIKILSLVNLFEGSKWIKICERDPNISERELSGGLFWTCDFNSNTPKQKIRLFDDNVWYLKKVGSKNVKWNPDFKFTHWLKQGFYIPQISNEEIEEINKYREDKESSYNNQLIFYI
jgi:hypothetical protein